MRIVLVSYLFVLAIAKSSQHVNQSDTEIVQVEKPSTDAHEVPKLDKETQHFFQSSTEIQPVLQNSTETQQNLESTTKTQEVIYFSTKTVELEIQVSPDAVLYKANTENEEVQEPSTLKEIVGIMGGTTTTINQYPSMVAMLATADWSTWRQLCGGVIINQRSVLTAAHCVSGDHVSKWRIRVGSTFANSGGTVHRLQAIIVHRHYNDVCPSNNDIAIVRPSTNIVYIADTVKPGAFAGTSYKVYDDEEVWAAGWGAVSPTIKTSETLRHVQVWIVNQKKCTKRYKELGKTVNKNMLCSGWLDVGGRDQCSGDSGGPLMHDGIVVGISSWGEQCGLPRYPGVNVRISNYFTWINENS